MLMDTYLNSLDRVALNIELRLQNDLKQALDLDEVEPAWQQEWVLNVDAQVLAHERNIVGVRILLEQSIDQFGTLLSQNHCKFILTSIRSNKFQHYGLNFFPIFKFKQVDVFDKADECLSILRARLDHLRYGGRIERLAWVLPIDYLCDTFQVLLELALFDGRSQDRISSGSLCLLFRLHLQMSDFGRNLV